MYRRIFLLAALMAASAFGQEMRWPAEKAQAWYNKQEWLVGANYIPASAINQLEMWQADTFDPGRIDTELGWAEDIGMNTMRVFLHDLLWKQDPKGFKHRIDIFLRLAKNHGIKPVFVLFDSCWDPFPALGKQREPKPGVHNSGWVQGPGETALQDPHEYGRLEEYVKGVVGAFKHDDRILAWDVWNEPDNPNTSSYGTKELKNKTELILPLMTKAFTWARSMKPRQPLTSGIWRGSDWSSLDKLTAIERVQVEESDIITFHNYDGPDKFRARVVSLQGYHRPIICTEYMARGNGSTFEGILPIAKELKIGAINWGLVQGKTQTNMPWDSWAQAYTNGRDPQVWFHEVFRQDGKPYRPAEVEFLKKITGRGAEKKKKAA